MTVEQEGKQSMQGEENEGSLKDISERKKKKKTTYR